MNDIVPRNQLTSYGMRSAGGLGGGVALCVAGGIINAIHIPLLSGLLGGLLGLGGLGFLIFGAFNLYRFIKGMKARS